MNLAYQIPLCLPLILIFSDHKNVKHLFAVVNNELANIKDWFIANKQSLTVEKIKYSFFHKPSEEDGIPLRLQKLIINNIYKLN